MYSLIVDKIQLYIEFNLIDINASGFSIFLNKTVWAS